MPLRRLTVLLFVLGHCLVAFPVRAQCSDCFVPYLEMGLEDDEPFSGGTPETPRHRAQAGDVTAVSVSSLVDEVRSTVPEVLLRALVAADSGRTRAEASLFEALSGEGLSLTVADSLAEATTGLFSAPITSTRVRVLVRMYDRVFASASDGAPGASGTTFEALATVVNVLKETVPISSPTSGAVDSSQHAFAAEAALSRLGVDEPRGHPSSTIITPTAFGPGWGQLFAGVSYQNRIRYSDWQDGVLVFGGGLGNPTRTVGLSVVVRLLDTYTEFAKDRSLSLTLHRRGPYRTAVAVGYENLWHTDGTDGGNSRYAVLSSVLPFRTDVKAPLGSIVVSGGIGTDRFLSEPRFARGDDGFSPFGSVGLRLLRPVNGIVNWSGQDLNVGISVALHPRLPFVVTPAVLDVTGSAGDGARWAVSASVGYNARR